MRRSRAVCTVAAICVPLLAEASDLVEMQHGMADARLVPAYTLAERGEAARRVLNLASRPRLAPPVSLTPNAPYAADGSSLSFWKPSFVIGTAQGGEAGINFWGKFQEGHMNVGLNPRTPAILDCRMLSPGKIAYKIYAGGGNSPRMQGEAGLRDGHLLLLLSPLRPGECMSVELWPHPATAPLGIFGCDISPILEARP